MRKSYLVVIILFGTLTFFGSCKKCITCQAYDRGDSSIQNQEEYCGPGADIKESEKNYIYIWNNTRTFAECK
jgi:hypothetical protein